MSSANNKRIAKNTGMLYIRMLLTMSVSLYTTRVVLATLGIEDYGIYTVVGGFVTMFRFLSSSMAAATQRFLSFEIGREDFPQLARVFSMSVNIHFMIALLILLLAETIGLWFVTTQLTIPTDRMLAAKWVYHFSILSFLVSVISVPYNAAIIAHEKMNVFAWVSIIEVTLKLLIVFMLQCFDFDKLKLYAVLLFSVELTLRLIYGNYCSRHFSESKYIFVWDKSLFRTLLSYAAWNLWGNAAVALYGQGINILLNIFFGPVVNAARGIAYQIMGAVTSFVQNFQTAINPQIIKSYASNDITYMHQLIFQGAKYSFFLLFTLTLPILLETELLLGLWLKDVPEYAVIFTQLVIINVLINSISGPLMTAAHASGKIRLYQGVVGGLLLLIFPISYFFLILDYPPQVTLYVSIFISLISLMARSLIISHLVNLSIRGYIKNVILTIIPVALIAVILPLLLRYSFVDSLLRLIIVIPCSIVSTATSIYFIALSHGEKRFAHEIIKHFLNKLKIHMP